LACDDFHKVSAINSLRTMSKMKISTNKNQKFLRIDNEGIG